jgi:parallel beta-helix repeat protein
MIKRINSFRGNGNILYVGGSGPENYSSIQNAINNASTNDTVFVYDDSSPYIENIIINKSISLKGEDKNSTIIDGSKIGDVIFVSANFVNISGFTIENSGNVNRDAGIKIQSKKNRVIGNIIQNNDDGIGLISASYNIITNNNISNNEYGFRIFISSKNLIFENIIYLNKFRGVRIETSNDNIIFRNMIYNNGNGVRFEDSDYNNFTSNKISNNGIGLNLISSIGSTVLDNIFINDGLEVQDSYKNTISNNLVNGRPIVYLEEESNKIIGEAGQILLINCENITIKNQNIYNVTYGILLWQTNNSFISENNLYSNDFNGILLHSSSNNIINKNNISNCDNGISLEKDCNHNIITENIISNNSYGVHLIYSEGNSNISNNTISDNLYGIQLYDSHDNFVTNNILSKNYFGISLWQFSSDNFVFSNDIYNCVNGIWVKDSNDNHILRNTIIGSEFNGIWLLESIHNKIEKNNVIECKCSVEITFSNFNILNENIFQKGGICVFLSYHNTVTNNIVNNKPLVYLEDVADKAVEEAGQVLIINCERIIVQNNEFSDIIIGLYLENTDYCQIINNSFINNYYASYLLFSDNNTFSKNVVSNYDQLGLYLLNSNDNTLSENCIFLEINKENEISYFYEKNILTNNYSINLFSDDNNNDSQAILIEGCYRNTLLKNNISNNNFGIVLESYCIKNTIERNNILSNKKTGILIIDSCENNYIFRNKIEKNGEFGIYLSESSHNKIKKNTFLENNNSAYFEYSFFNRWIKNYWDSFRFFPKTISGKIKINSRRINWINIDWRPAKIPFLL